MPKSTSLESSLHQENHPPAEVAAARKSVKGEVEDKGARAMKVHEMQEIERDDKHKDEKEQRCFLATPSHAEDDFSAPLQLCIGGQACSEDAGSQRA